MVHTEIVPDGTRSWILSDVSLTNAALTWLSSIYRRERSWRGRKLAKAAIDVIVAQWELEFAKAKLVLDPQQRLNDAYIAKVDLFMKVRGISAY